ncbi:polyadenylate-binding protein-interacting protein 2B isoform X2 [Aphelocoma coerulescens]|uniref:polyadenylate-binding protein-interacting protein 2B isoform X2 n=1 Tax=Aphelocoma coerulescens TaxID=39617 RepID=UPI0036044A85
MNGSELAGTSASNPKSKEDPVGNGHEEKEKNPFAEYMWMENEEDFNRQVEEELQEQEFLDRCFQEMLEEDLGMGSAGTAGWEIGNIPAWKKKKNPGFTFPVGKVDFPTSAIP